MAQSRGSFERYTYVAAFFVLYVGLIAFVVTALAILVMSFTAVPPLNVWIGMIVGVGMVGVGTVLVLIGRWLTTERFPPMAYYPHPGGLMGGLTCPGCGMMSPAGSKFCTFCGKALAPAATEAGPTRG